MNELTARHEDHKAHKEHEARIEGIFVSLVCFVSFVV